jgi:thiamine-phosphate pyrophosphorylase
VNGEGLMSDLMQILDANLNRSMEGLRVCEDLLRFSLGTEISSQFKEHRQLLGAMRRQLGNDNLLRARDIESDGQKFVDGTLEKERSSAEDIFTANIKRAQESARVIEELMKIIDASMSTSIQKLRFSLYDLETKGFAHLSGKKQRDSLYYSLYGIIDSEFIYSSYENTAEEMIEGGAKVLQLRMKHASRAVILETAKKIAQICRKSDVLFIMNDYPDLAVLCRAEGLHLGQDDIPVEEARKIVGDISIIGISTHSKEEIDKAVKTSADYIAVGPVFGTTSKGKEALSSVGMDLVTYASEKASVPIVPIGGITLNNIKKLMNKGAHCPAVISALYENGDIKKNCVSFLTEISQIEKEMYK